MFKSSFNSFFCQLIFSEFRGLPESDLSSFRPLDAKETPHYLIISSFQQFNHFKDYKYTFILSANFLIKVIYENLYIFALTLVRTIPLFRQFFYIFLAAGLLEIYWL